MNIAIIDDDIDFCLKLKSNFEKFFSSLFNKYAIDIICDEFISNTMSKDYDIIFLDIDLKKLNGIDIGKRLLISENNPIIIFVSSRSDLVFSSLSVRPFYFVRKSCLESDLKIMYILLRKYLKENMSLFTFEFHGRITNLFLKDIFIIESKGHDIILHTKNGDYTYRSTMKKILDVLGTKTIVQFQKAYAINLDYIKEINKGVIVLKNNKEFNIGRKFKDNFMQKYKEHFLI